MSDRERREKISARFGKPGSWIIGTRRRNSGFAMGFVAGVVSMGLLLIVSMDNEGMYSPFGK